MYLYIFCCENWICFSNNNYDQIFLASFEEVYGLLCLCLSGFCSYHYVDSYCSFIQLCFASNRMSCLDIPTIRQNMFYFNVQ